jgi:hypothetical protein
MDLCPAASLESWRSDRVFRIRFELLLRPTTADIEELTATIFRLRRTT